MECGLNTVADEKLLYLLLFFYFKEGVYAWDDINLFYLHTLNKEFLYPYTLFNYVHIQSQLITGV